MSHENVDKLRAFIEAWIRGEGEMSLLDPEVTLRYAYIWISEGRVIRFESVRDPQEALEAIGLRE